jgi:hypothetical protein
VRQPLSPRYSVQPLVNRPVRLPFLTPGPPFWAFQPRNQDQNSADPDDSHREYQCDRFLGAHTAILCLAGFHEAAVVGLICQPSPLMMLGLEGRGTGLECVRRVRGASGGMLSGPGVLKRRVSGYLQLQGHQKLYVRRLGNACTT